MFLDTQGVTPVLYILALALLFGQDPAELGEKLIKQALEQDKRDAPRVRLMACKSEAESKNLDLEDLEHKEKFHLTLQDWLGTGRYTYRLNPEVPILRRNFSAFAIVFAPNSASLQPQVPVTASIEDRAKQNVLNNLVGVAYIDPTTGNIREVQAVQLRDVEIELDGSKPNVVAYNAHVDYSQQYLAGTWVPESYRVAVRIALSKQPKNFRIIGKTVVTSAAYHCSPPPPAR